MNLFAGHEIAYISALKKNQWVTTTGDRFSKAGQGKKNTVDAFRFLSRIGSVTLNLPNETEVDSTEEQLAKG